MIRVDKYISGRIIPINRALYYDISSITNRAATSLKTYHSATNRVDSHTWVAGSSAYEYVCASGA